MKSTSLSVSGVLRIISLHHHLTIVTTFHRRTFTTAAQVHEIAGVRWASARPVEHSCDRGAARPADTAALSVQLPGAPECHATAAKPTPWRANW